MRTNIKTVLIVGFGSIGRRYVGIIQTFFPDVCVVVLRHQQCDDSNTVVSAAFKCVTSIDEAIKLQPQAAIIANPASKHIKIANILAKKSIHLLIEKPISNSSKGIQELINVCRLNQLVLMTGYNLRFLPSLVEFKKQIQSRVAGKIYSVRSEVGQYLPNWRPGSDYRKGVSAQANMGGGALLELSHEIDYLLWIFGRANWIKSHVSKQSALEIDVEDSAYVILGFEERDGSALTASLNIDFIRHDTVRSCFAIGENGTLLWDGVKGEVKFLEQSSVDWKTLFSSTVERDFTYMEQIKLFFSSIESGSISQVSGEDGLQVVRVVEKIKESSSKKSMIFC